MKRVYCAAALVLLALAGASANTPGSPCKDEITGYSANFGVTGATKALTYKDQTDVWRKNGQITKINLYYSWTYKCLQGFKATYNWDAKTASLIGHEVKGLTTVDMKLNANEHINKVELRAKNGRCIEWIKLYSTKNRSLSIGDGSSKSPLQTATVNRKAGFLAAVRGKDTAVTKNGKTTAGDLQQLQFVWADYVCPKPAPVPKPSPKPSPVPKPSPKPVPVESPTPTDSPEPAPTPVPSPSPKPTPAPVCKNLPQMCTTDVDLGLASFCPFVNPFTQSVCLGGCCQSVGKCKAPFCSLSGLGADVMSLDFICLGKNEGLFGGLNKCKNLGCKLAVPGCVSDHLGGSCMGTVTAMSSDIDADAAKYVGMPCLESTKKLLPFDKFGLFKGAGEYVSGLWTVCDCNSEPLALPTLPEITLPQLGGDCQGPLCGLLPKLPDLNLTLPDLQLPFALLETLIKKPALPTLPTLPDLAALLPPKPQISLPALPSLPALDPPSLPKFPSPADLKTLLDTVSAAVGAVPDSSSTTSDPIKALLSSFPSLLQPFQLPKLDLPLPTLPTLG